jgi:prepilin-type processing-associated H-X9-DG protein
LLVIVLLIVLIGSLVLPSLAKARQKAAAQESLEYGRSIGTAFQEYATKHDGALVPVSAPKPGDSEEMPWTELLRAHGDYSPRARVMQFGIGYNRRLSQLRDMGSICNPTMTVAFGDTGEIENPGETNPDNWRESPRKLKNKKALVFETPGAKEWETSPSRMINRHRGRASVVFADGRALLMPVSAVGFQYKAGHSRALWDNK